MKRERTTNGTWIYTARVRGRLLVSEDADRKEAFFGMIELILGAANAGLQAGEG